MDEEYLGHDIAVPSKDGVADAVDQGDDKEHQGPEVAARRHLGALELKRRHDPGEEDSQGRIRGPYKRRGSASPSGFGIML